MILLTEVEIKGNGKTLNYYKSRGYDIECNKIIKVKIEDLIETSSIKIDCYCDICNSLNNIKYYGYIGNIKRNGIYRCNECTKPIRNIKIRDIFSNNELKNEVVNKRRNTNLERYGFDSPLKCDSIKEKQQNTNLERYGYRVVSKSIYTKEKMENTNMSIYGYKYTFCVPEIKEKIKNTCNEKYGVDNVFQNEEIKQKIKNTLMEKYGVDNPTKNKEIFDKAQKNSYRILKYYDSEITYQGTYELDFINFCIDNNINFESGPTIDYILDGVNRKYHSDFYLPDYNLICEVKSTWTYNRDIEENLAKEEFSKKIGYNFVFIIDKNYDYLKLIISKT